MKTNITIFPSLLQINPDMAQSHALKGWYDSEGESLTTTSLTQARGAGGAGGSMGVGSNLKTMSEVKRENIGFTEDGRPAFYSTSGYIIMFQKDKALYKACNRSPDGKQCNKKVTNQLLIEYTSCRHFKSQLNFFGSLRNC